MEESVLTQLKNIRALYADAAPTDKKRVEEYAWIVCKGINKCAEELGGLMCRQLLADIMHMPIERPSVLYSSILWSATKVATLFPEFHFVPFLNIWGANDNLRTEDFEQKKDKDGKVFPSLAERMVKTVLLAEMIRPDEQPTQEINVQAFGYHPVAEMVVTKLIQAEVKGRKMWFANLISAEGMETSVEMHSLRRSPLIQSTERHYVNVGQLYNVVLKDKANSEEVRVVDAVLSQRSLVDAFPSCVGYVENYDSQNEHIHIYDGHSRHFVSSGQRFIKAEKGQLVTFVPIIPQKNLFKTAIIVKSQQSQDEMLNGFPLRDVRITNANSEKGYYSWQLLDEKSPITEILSPLQIAKGELSPSFTNGFVNMDVAKKYIPNINVGDVVKAIVFLRRGKDKQKRPFVALLKQ